jgi:glycosyltransferase involved in cell wall biosynthesis
VRVLADANTLRRPAAGTQRWVSGLLTGLAALPDVELFCEDGPARLGDGWRWRVPNTARQRWWYEIGLPRAARSHRADVMLLPANLSARRVRIPQVVTLLDVNFLTSLGTYEPLFVRYATWMWRRAARDADRLTTISAFSRTELCRHLDADPDRIDVVYPGVETPVPVPDSAAPHARAYALFVGATERHKNVETLLNAWDPVRGPAELDLVIVGRPGRAHDEIVRRASAIGSRVRIAGAVGDDELERWYRHARVLVMPSLAEGFGYPPLEAMLRGVPVVASTAGSLPEVLGDAALFHDPFDVERLIRLVAEAAEDGATRARLIEAGRARAARYTWSNSAAAMHRVLGEVAARD